MEQEISLCMIIKNEEKYIENCLNSIKDLVGEIIIIDTGSTDKTKEIAKKFTNKLFDFPWENNFSKARNFAISKASKTWVLFLDADETISQIDKEKIKNLLKNNKRAKADAFVLKCRNYTNNMGVVGWLSSKKDKYKESEITPGFWVLDTIRLFKNKKNFFFEGKIHETVYNSIKNSKGKILDTDVIIHHFGELDKEKLINKKNIYIEILKTRLTEKDFSEKSKDYIYYELAGELIKLNKIDEAISYLEKATKISENFDYLLQLGGLYILKKKLNEAEKTLKKAVLLSPNNSSVHDNLGIVYSEKGSYNKAIRKFEKAIQLNPNSADAYFNLYLVYRKKRKTRKMNEFFEKAAQLNPKYKEKLTAS